MVKNEIEIIEACKKGDKYAFKQIFDTYSRKLLAIACRYTVDKSEAEDVLQDTFIKVFKTIHNYQSRGSFEGWLRRIVVTTSLNYYKSKKSKMNEHYSSEVEFIHDESFSIDAHLNSEDLLKIIHQLPDGYRMVFNLNVIEGYTHKEIAEQLGISEGTSKSQLAKAKKVLKSILVNEKLVA